MLMTKLIRSGCYYFQHLEVCSKSVGGAILILSSFFEGDIGDEHCQINRSLVCNQIGCLHRHRPRLEKAPHKRWLSIAIGVYFSLNGYGFACTAGFAQLSQYYGINYYANICQRTPDGKFPALQKEVGTLFLCDITATHLEDSCKYQVAHRHASHVNRCLKVAND